ncbi:hypothetical protein ABZN20_10280 [Methylococcus sp. ANG]|uniref:hypothetical protein n=1 Tax=Methylococcus sp. ANG TaxID=3231903 RepID=UPI00345A9CCF
MTKYTNTRRGRFWDTNKPGPWLRRKTNTKNSSLFWGAYSIGMFAEAKLSEHMRDVPKLMHELFNKHRKSLPRNSSMATGPVYGTWLHCPNALADEVEATIKRRHAEFLAQGYDDMELMRECVGPIVGSKLMRAAP